MLAKHLDCEEHTSYDSEKAMQSTSLSNGPSWLGKLLTLKAFICRISLAPSLTYQSTASYLAIASNTLSA